jgi:hypothetical protein
LKDVNGKYIGNRPVKLKKSTWDEKDSKEARKREKEREKKIRMGEAT